MSERLEAPEVSSGWRLAVLDDAFSGSGAGGALARGTTVVPRTGALDPDFEPHCRYPKQARAIASPATRYFHPRPAPAPASGTAGTSKIRVGRHTTLLFLYAGDSSGAGLALLSEAQGLASSGAPHRPQNLWPGGLLRWQSEHATSWTCSDGRKSAERAGPVDRFPATSLLISSKSWLTACSRFSGGLLKYTLAQRSRFRSRTELVSGFNSDWGGAPGLLSHRLATEVLRHDSIKQKHPDPRG